MAREPARAAARGRTRRLQLTDAALQAQLEEVQASLARWPRGLHERMRAEVAAAARPAPRR